MNRKTKIAIPVIAGVVAVGTGAGLVWAQDAGRNGAAAYISQSRYGTVVAPSAAGGGTVEANWCGGPGAGGMMGQAIAQPVAALLGVTPADLQAQLQAGKALADIAREKGVGQDSLVKAILGPMNEQMDLMVKYGYMTREQADSMVERMRTWAQTLITSKALDLNGPGFMGGMMGGAMGDMMGGRSAQPQSRSSQNPGGFGGMMGGSRGMMGGW